MFSAMDISTSGMVAQRVRLNAISSNLANVSTQINEAGDNVPYQPRFVVFQTDESLASGGDALGVRVSSVETDDVEPRLKYEPHSPLADANGMVRYPNIDLTREFVDALEATRSYEANIGTMEITKDLMQQSLRLLA